MELGHLAQVSLYLLLLDVPFVTPLIHGGFFSLVSRLIYDGENFVHSALGDAFPEQIRYSVVHTGSGTPSGTALAVTTSSAVCPL